MIFGILTDSATDVLKMVPIMFLILFVTDLITLKLNTVQIHNSPLGVLGGSLFGIIPQCGVSVGFAQLYAKGAIGLGMLFAVFLSCSDEALIIAAANYRFSFVLRLIATKILLAVVVGLIIYAVMRLAYKRASGERVTVDLAEDLKAELRKQSVGELLRKDVKVTLWITLYVFAAVLVLNTLLQLVGESAVETFMTGRNLFLQPILAVLIGFIPNCASSAFITEAYINGFIHYGALIAGLCANTGYGILVIFRARPLKQALKILGLLLGVSVLIGEALILA